MKPSNNPYSKLRAALKQLATPLRDPEPLREIVDELLRILADEPK